MGIGHMMKQSMHVQLPDAAIDFAGKQTVDIVSGHHVFWGFARVGITGGI